MFLDLQTSLCTQRAKERSEKEGDQSMLAGGSFNKQGNLLARLVLGSCNGRSLYPSIRILKLYIGALTGFSSYGIQVVCVCVCVCARVHMLSCVQLFATPWSIAHQLLYPWIF